MSKEARATLNRFLIATALLVLLAALIQELRTPKDRRTWHGTVFGVVPYDFRPPSFEQVRRAFWNPSDPRILTPRAVGVGWSVNIPALVKVLRDNRLVKRA
ncbi:MAG: DUF5808 domain-containing protein [Chloroflexota bacterium]|nr:DUF5808 domain-containing protein [Dehalococcoidia bacterium]MDW8254915.1 DUF5808 domain-containing protein [Chloroflexota bacterium]